MTDQHHARAVRVVQAFKESISEAALECISDAQLEKLTLMIGEAISEELSEAALMIEDVAKKLRSQTDRLELGL
jgi:hypothetical protein